MGFFGTCVILHQPISRDSSADELDTLHEVTTISDALRDMGYSVLPLVFDESLSDVRARLLDIQPSFVFNLVESCGAELLIEKAPRLLEQLSIPYTGCSADAICKTNHKLLAKSVLTQHGLPTPLAYDSSSNPATTLPSSVPFIIKAVSEHASFQMDDASIFVPDNFSQLQTKIKEFEARFHTAFFAEEYIDGREFNIAMIGPQNNPIILPVSEIQFIHFQDIAYKTVGYKAKWDPDSFEYQHTQRSFAFSQRDSHSISQMKKLALNCWQVFQLNGYARVDFRLDPNHNPYILEINANPCISPDSGLVASAAEHGLTYCDLLRIIIESRIA